MSAYSELESPTLSVASKNTQIDLERAETRRKKEAARGKRSRLRVAEEDASRKSRLTELKQETTKAEAGPRTDWVSKIGDMMYWWRRGNLVTVRYESQGDLTSSTELGVSPKHVRVSALDKNHPDYLSGRILLATSISNIMRSAVPESTLSAASDDKTSMPDQYDAVSKEKGRTMPNKPPRSRGPKGVDTHKNQYQREYNAKLRAQRKETKSVVEDQIQRLERRLRVGTDFDHWVTNTFGLQLSTRSPLTLDSDCLPDWVRNYCATVQADPDVHILEPWTSVGFKYDMRDSSNVSTLPGEIIAGGTSDAASVSTVKQAQRESRKRRDDRLKALNSKWEELQMAVSAATGRSSKERLEIIGKMRDCWMDGDSAELSYDRGTDLASNGTIHVRPIPTAGPARQSGTLIQQQSSQSHAFFTGTTCESPAPYRRLVSPAPKHTWYSTKKIREKPRQVSTLIEVETQSNEHMLRKRQAVGRQKSQEHRDKMHKQMSNLGDEIRAFEEFLHAGAVFDRWIAGMTSLASAGGKNERKAQDAGPSFVPTLTLGVSDRHDQAHTSTLQPALQDTMLDPSDFAWYPTDQLLEPRDLSPLDYSGYLIDIDYNEVGGVGNGGPGSTLTTLPDLEGSEYNDIDWELFTGFDIDESPHIQMES